MRFSQSLASLRQRLSQAIVRSNDPALGHRDEAFRLIRSLDDLGAKFLRHATSLSDALVRSRRPTALFLDREPKGGYGGYYAEIILLPRGVKPGTKTAPQPPGEADGDKAEE